ncbi:MAG: hypothetical protein LDL39_12795 [Magnetospirillum sp.]|nr:hypothetical protein [Magnetospirillum sp.]
MTARAALILALTVAGIVAASASQLPPDPPPRPWPPALPFSTFIPPKP